ncbi:MAG: 3-hydroxyacyl-CoA dehydrogenase/enoyl-CoA hydratase family protein [Actinobacteria bacterium]|nr:3-hydroxyacyl-CoA dehydrogenase/enoyl-CoA hydratase family protein [Actinomycetota bacterium]
MCATAAAGAEAESGISRVAVIGAGLMGSGIAAHLANAGAEVLLLDIVPADLPEGASRSLLAEGALAKLLKSDPAAFMHRRNARRVTPGNIEDHLDRLAEVDWVIEAVVERLDVKHEIYARIDAARKPGCIVSSNTSTIPLTQLLEGASDDFARDFMITHFFNPPRYMRLLELVTGDRTDPAKAEAVRAFADVRLGKGVVPANDTPGFIANRIGGFWLQCSMVEAIDAGLSIEVADAVLGRPMGAPKTGVFALLDLVGLDTVRYVGRSLMDGLPPDDAFRAVHREPELVTRLIDTGYVGRKGKGGFYRLNTEGGRRVKEAIDLATGEYHPAARPRLDSVAAAKRGGLRALVESPDAGGVYAWRVLSRTLSYAASLVPTIAPDVTAVDEAMRLGYNWKKGPFELIDDLGAAWFAERLEADGQSVPPLLAAAAADGAAVGATGGGVTTGGASSAADAAETAANATGGGGATVVGGTFYRTVDGVLEYRTVDGSFAPVERRPGVLLLADVKRRGERVAGNSSASLWDIGDGVLCLEFHGFANAFDDGTLKMVGTAIETVLMEGFKGLVLYNDGDNYSVGANIGLGLFAANISLWPPIQELVEGGQQAYRFLKYAPFPVVAAPAGMALGGGCESLLHSDAIQAHAESYIGLPEAGLGLLPAWGGSKEMLLRHTRNPNRVNGPMPPIAGAFETISMAKISRSAEEARELLFLGEGDRVTMNRDRLLADAKATVLELVEGYAPPEEPTFNVPGASAKSALEIFVNEFVNSGRATEYDGVVSGHIATVLSGGDTDLTEEISEERMLELEREGFLALIREPRTLARVEHMLETGKPLRN